MVEPTARIPLGSHQIPTWCYRCNRYTIIIVKKKCEAVLNMGTDKHLKRGEGRKVNRILALTSSHTKCNKTQHSIPGKLIII
jgi:hypothetical protein